MQAPLLLMKGNRAAVRVNRAATAAALLILGGCGGSSSAPTYRLEGTVSGLRGSGLVLANAKQMLGVSAGATMFNFGSVLTSGASYKVTVQTQPAGQTCSIANGSGAATGASVGNVVVTCSQLASSLGGTLSGLTVSGLVLANGSDTLSVPADATTFTLPTPVATGSSYAVTVHAQPAGMSCAVISGTGTMPASAVTTVAVSCTDQPFSLGGSITGLTVGGLVLGNGADVRTLAAGTTSFTMPMKVDFDAAYTILIKTQPTGLTCTVSNGSGNMPASDVTHVAVTCADRSFTLGGSVSGLSANGLIIANGSDTVAVPAGAVSFTMPVSVAYGSSYAVIVQAQPVGLVCTVSSGTGAMPANNFVGVTVACGVTYTVGGSINGLNSSGLVLMNGSDVLTVAANAASFTMPTGAASGSAYAVVVQTQPSGQLCTVGNGNGMVAGGDVNSVQVTCGPLVLNFTAVGAATWTVPNGVASIQVVAIGGGGGGGGGEGNRGGSLGGNGGVVTVTLAVNAGDVVNLNVGGGGGNGEYGASGSFGGGGGGGGSTSVNVNSSLATQIIAGGAGGGYGDDGNASNGGDGNGGNSGPNGGGSGGANGIGGAAGSILGLGGSGQDAGANGDGGPGGAGGANGVGIAGGLAGAGTGSGSGGSFGTNCSGGGGGGYGGGGGGFFAGGGGGGSTGPAGAVFSLAANSGGSAAPGGDGSLVITISP